MMQYFASLQGQKQYAFLTLLQMAIHHRELQSANGPIVLCIQTKKLIKYSPAKKPIGPNTVRVKRLARTSVNPPQKFL